jgi:hypothetical protein
LKLGADTAICQGSYIMLSSPVAEMSFIWEDGTSLKQRILSESGTYWLKVIDSMGCSAIDTFQLNVNPLPAFDMGTDIQLKENEKLEVRPDLPKGKYFYQWSTGQDASEVTIDSKDIRETFSLSLTIIDSLQCTFTDELLVSPPKSFNQGMNYEVYSIFPNPTKGKFVINIPRPDIIKQLRIYDTRGILIRQFNMIFNQPLEIDLSGMAKGTYLLIIQEESDNKEYKIILE